MKKLLSAFFVVTGMLGVADAAPQMVPATGRGRQTMSEQMMPSPRSVMSKNQISGVASLTPDTTVVKKSSIKLDDVKPNSTTVPENIVPEQIVVETPAIPKDMREKEKQACLNNNVGVGNTFVWAARNSDINNYAAMVEDIENPENNTCFVKVEMRSDDSRISVADIPAKYFEWGQSIECGSWADYEMMKGRILDAKKKARVWGTVATTIAGTGIGFGISEAAITAAGKKGGDSKLHGQVALSGSELMRSQLAVLKKENQSEYDTFVRNLRTLKTNCEKFKDDAEIQNMCTTYSDLFDLAG